MNKGPARLHPETGRAMRGRAGYKRLNRSKQLLSGSMPRRGSDLSAWLAAPKAVVRGEAVEIESREGSAIVQAPGQAQASGAIGEIILVLNPMSKKRFSARVIAQGKVAVGKGSL